MKNCLGIVAECLKGVTVTEALPLIKEAGFKSFFTDDYATDEIARIKAEGDRLGLSYPFVHAPYAGINSMWIAGDGYLDIFNGMKHSVDICADNGIPEAVIHLSSGWGAPPISDIGLARYDELVDYAGERGVCLAFENLRMVGNLAYFTERYDNLEHVRYCYDCGHEHCYTKYLCWMDIFREKTSCTHIHDNFGIHKKWEEGTDKHLLPFDGTLDYARMMRKLREYDYKGDLMLEVFQSAAPEYIKMSHREFLDTAYQRLLKISQM